jgi:hypothetical protein
MIRHPRLDHRFVNSIPRQLEPGVLYISIECATAIHTCCCGCGEEVVTPLTPTDWKLIFDGETVSLWPSIGNWSYACRSHYVIERNRVIEALPWSDRRVANARQWDKFAKANFYSGPKVGDEQYLGPLGSSKSEASDKNLYSDSLGEGKET